MTVLWSGVVAFALCFIVASTILLPGSRHRKRARISVTPARIFGDGVNLPIERIAEISVGNNGVAVSWEPLVVGPHGVPTSTLVGVVWGGGKPLEASRCWCAATVQAALRSLRAG